MDWQNENYQKQLEAEIHRELERLPDLEAPVSLNRRVMAAIAQRAAAPWYCRSWEFWPLPLRVGALVLMLGCFGGLCYASWQLTRAAGFTAAMQEVGQLFSGVAGLCNAFVALLSALVLVIKHLGTPYIIAICLVSALGYALCVGLGTMFYRLAFARKL